ncbi:hypothetical protein H6F67_12300 [Microcoleus sp. FACHB-1515]|nr:hypothetical protein [Microcoleus sp. FACHB-1515]MBD2090635.1 hypothetical protein [Microcoleus sp. FACHB-1515]
MAETRSQQGIQGGQRQNQSFSHLDHPLETPAKRRFLPQFNHIPKAIHR